MTETNNPKDLPLLCWRAIFRNEPFIYKNGWCAKTLSSIKRLKMVRIGKWTYVEQNKYTGSHWAREAKKGKEIMWIIFTPKNGERKYFGRVVDGVFTKC
jgi:hypothetical protein